MEAIFLHWLPARVIVKEIALDGAGVVSGDFRSMMISGKLLFLFLT